MKQFVKKKVSFVMVMNHGCDNRNLHVAADGSVCARGGDIR